LLFAKEGANIIILYLNEHKDAKETKAIIEKKYKRCCLLISGDISKEAPFSLLNPQYTLQAKIAMIPVAMVRQLSYRRLLKPEPMHGKKAMYRLAR